MKYVQQLPKQIQVVLWKDPLSQCKQQHYGFMDHLGQQQMRKQPQHKAGLALLILITWSPSTDGVFPCCHLVHLAELDSFKAALISKSTIRWMNVKCQSSHSKPWASRDLLSNSVFPLGSSSKHFNLSWLLGFSSKELTTFISVVSKTHCVLPAPHQMAYKHS